MKYNCNELSKKMNPDMKKLAKDNEYLFIQDGTRNVERQKKFDY